MTLHARQIITGFESTYMPAIGTDVLHGTRHNEHFRHDFKLVKALGITTIRYPAPWHYIQQDKNTLAWAWLDERLAALQELGISPILDLVHHSSIPETIFKRGFASSNFPKRLAEFAAQCAERYPWVTHYTIFNEPYLTAQFCGEAGIWFPWHKGKRSFVSMVLNITQAISEASQVLRSLGREICLVHTETCERHSAAPSATEGAIRNAEFANQRRFLVDDLLHGWVTTDHPLYRYLLENGATETQLDWLHEHTAVPDVRGLDYYAQSELVWTRSGKKRWSKNPTGFALVAEDYVRRYKIAFMLSETNFFGTEEARAAWFQTMWQEYQVLLKKGYDLRGFCWFPFVNSTDFQHLLRKNRNDIDPVGIYDLDTERHERIPTRLVSLIEQIVSSSPETISG